MSVGERIATLRRERGISQAGLAAATGVSRSAVAQWETGRAGQVSGNLSRIAKVLDVSVEVLLHGTAARGPEGLTGDQLALLRLYRICGAEGQAALLRMARRLARAAGEPGGDPGV
jgi:transcriptional regulator with XRE-family HTH domain